MIPWLENNACFPPLESALPDPNGLLCASQSLSPQLIIEAYCSGIFPWYSSGDPVLWWSPDPRMVLFPNEIKISRSLSKALRAGGYQVRLDYAFYDVIHACASIRRKDQEGTWITDDMLLAYTTLFELGFAHSVETWVDGELMGGVYGLAIGKMFYGESMFFKKTNASKIALAHLVAYLDAHRYGLIDCQMNTPYLASLGAREIPRSDFLHLLRELVFTPPLRGRWPVDDAVRNWN